jgi:hypothetical protein
MPTVASPQYVSVSHKTMHWLMGQAGLGQLRCCQENGVVKCYDTANGCVLTWVSTATPQGEPPCPICTPGGAAAPPSAPSPSPSPAPAPPGTVPAPAPPGAPPSWPTIIDLPPPRPRPTVPGLPPTVPTPAPVPAPAPSVGFIEIGLVLRILELSETAWFRIERARIRARRCGATDAEKAAIVAAERCLASLRKSGGELRKLVDELCLAKEEGRSAKVTPAQAEALEVFASCVTDALGEAEAEAKGVAPWLEALIGMGLPAAGSVLISS